MTSIIVVGAGVTGVTTALACARAGVRTYVVDKAASADELRRKQRATGSLILNRRMTPLFSQLGLSDEFRSLLFPLHKLRIGSAAASSEILYSADAAAVYDTLLRACATRHPDLITFHLNSSYSSHIVEDSKAAVKFISSAPPSKSAASTDSPSGVVLPPASLLVGADGVCSSLRSAVCPTTASPVFARPTGLLRVTAVTHAAADSPFVADSIATATSLKGLRKPHGTPSNALIGSTMFTTVPLPDGRVAWTAVVESSLLEKDLATAPVSGGAVRVPLQSLPGSVIGKLAECISTVSTDGAVLVASSDPHAVMVEGVEYAAPILTTPSHGPVVVIGHARYGTSTPPPFDVTAAASIADATAVGEAVSRWKRRQSWFEAAQDHAASVATAAAAASDAAASAKKASADATKEGEGAKSESATATSEGEAGSDGAKSNAKSDSASSAGESEAHSTGGKEGADAKEGAQQSEQGEEYVDNEEPRPGEEPWQTKARVRGTQDRALMRQLPWYEMIPNIGRAYMEAGSGRNPTAAAAAEPVHETAAAAAAAAHVAAKAAEAEAAVAGRGGSIGVAPPGSVADITHTALTDRLLRELDAPLSPSPSALSLHYASQAMRVSSDSVAARLAAKTVPAAFPDCCRVPADVPLNALLHPWAPLRPLPNPLPSKAAPSKKLLTHLLTEPEIVTTGHATYSRRGRQQHTQARMAAHGDVAVLQIEAAGMPLRHTFSLQRLGWTSAVSSADPVGHPQLSVALPWLGLMFLCDVTLRADGSSTARSSDVRIFAGRRTDGIRLPSFLRPLTLELRFGPPVAGSWLVDMAICRSSAKVSSTPAADAADKDGRTATTTEKGDQELYRVVGTLSAVDGQSAFALLNTPPRQLPFVRILSAPSRGARAVRSKLEAMCDTLRVPFWFMVGALLIATMYVSWVQEKVTDVVGKAARRGTEAASSVLLPSVPVLRLSSAPHLSDRQAEHAHSTLPGVPAPADYAAVVAKAHAAQAVSPDSPRDVVAQSGLGIETVLPIWLTPVPSALKGQGV